MVHLNLARTQELRPDRVCFSCREVWEHGAARWNEGIITGKNLHRETSLSQQMPVETSKTYEVCS